MSTYNRKPIEWQVATQPQVSKQGVIVEEASLQRYGFVVTEIAIMMDYHVVLDIFDPKGEWRCVPFPSVGVAKAYAEVIMSFIAPTPEYTP